MSHRINNPLETKVFQPALQRSRGRVSPQGESLSRAFPAGDSLSLRSQLIDAGLIIPAPPHGLPRLRLPVAPVLRAQVDWMHEAVRAQEPVHPFFTWGGK